MKKIICAFSLLMLICTSAFAQPLYTKTSKEYVTGGVTRTNIQKFYGDYSLNINVITADLKNEHISLELLKKSGGCDKVDTVINLAKSEQNVVAATNADFFSAYKGSQNFSLGIEIKNGELLQSHINSEMAAGFFSNNALMFSYINFTGAVTAPNGATSALAHINKPTDYYGAVLMYTPEFNGGVSPFLPVGITAVTVENDIVTAKGISQGGTIPIPESGYILVIDDNMTPFLEYNFNIGDAVNVSLSTAQLTEGVDTAFGGGTLLLKDGVKTAITHDVAGNNPRTAIGTNSDGTVVYLLTVDGRQAISRGVTLGTLADICSEVGMVNAMNFDGGGSTAMVAKTLSDSELHHINSPSENRKVINAVAVTSDAKSGETAGFIVSPASSYVLSGDSVKLNLTPYDANYNKPSSTPYSYEWKVAQGSGSVKNDIYYAQGSGKTVLELYYNGNVTDTCEINVIGDVSGITAPASFALNVGESAAVKGVSVFDKYGNTAVVNDLALLNPAYDSSFISLTGNSVKVLREGGGNLTFSYGKASNSIKITCGEYNAPILNAVTTDVMHKSEAGGFSFNVMASTPSRTLIDRHIYARGMELLKQGEASAVIGGEFIKEFTPDGISPIMAQTWSEHNYQNTKVISVDLSQKGLLSRGSQWSQLNNALSGATHKNIILLFDSEPGFEASLDSIAFDSMVQNAAKNKNIFIVYCGDENAVKFKNGARYISISDSKDLGTAKSVVENMQYLSFNITADGVTYCYKNMYQPSGGTSYEGIILE